MLTVVDRPLIQHVVDEARQAGIEHFIFVTGRNKGVIEDHFDRQYELEHPDGGKRKADLELLVARPPGPGRRASPASNRRSVSATPCGARANSSATSRSRVLLPDVLVQADARCLAQMIDAYKTWRESEHHRRRGSADRRVHMYGIVGVGKPKGEAFEITEMVEKPARDKAPSNLSSPAATSCSRRFSTFSPTRRAAPAAKSSSPTR